MSDNVFRINEVFDSINGEVAGGGQGSVCRFIRFAGCNLQCSYCDTEHEDANILWTIEDLIASIKEGPLNVTFTGGEPLIQLTREKLSVLCDALNEDGFGYRFNIETNGTIAPEYFTPNIHYTMDYKMPSSGMNDEMKFSNFVGLRQKKDFIKFVCSTKNEIFEALEIAEEMRKLRIDGVIAISPVMMNRPGAGQPIGRGKALDIQLIHDMARKVYEHKFAREDGVIFSLQLHKILGVK